MATLVKSFAIQGIDAFMEALGVRYKLIYYKLNKIGCCIYVCMYSLIKNGTEKSVLFFVRNGLILPKVRQ